MSPKSKLRLTCRRIGQTNVAFNWRQKTCKGLLSKMSITTGEGANKCVLENCDTQAWSRGAGPPDLKLVGPSQEPKVSILSKAQKNPRSHCFTSKFRNKKISYRRDSARRRSRRRQVTGSPISVLVKIDLMEFGHYWSFSLSTGRGYLSSTHSFRMNHKIKLKSTQFGISSRN